MTAAPDDNTRQSEVDAEAQQWLLRLRSGEAGLQSAFEAWFASDPAHAESYERLLSAWDASAIASPARARRFWRQPWLTAIVAIVLVMVGVGALSLAGLGRSPAAAIELASRVGEIHTYRLPDGSTVTLDTDTRLAATFSSAVRRVHLERGRARFAVTANGTRPFEVDSASARVRTTGAVMDVAIDGDGLAVVTLSGSVAVAAGDAAPTILAADQASMIAPSRAPHKAAVAPGERRWVTGMLSFDDAPLGAVVAAANRYSVRKIRFGDAAAATLRFSGTFRSTDIAGLARMLAAAFHLSLTRDAQGNFVLASAGAGSPTP